MSFPAAYRMVNKAWLQSRILEGAELAIIDVRDDDYAGGHIPGCINIPSYQFPDQVTSLVERLQGVPAVVFHCALSQQRGPKAALQYSRALAAAKAGHKETQKDASPNVIEPPTVSSADAQRSSEQEVLVLRGGATEWVQAFKDDPKLVEDYDARFWR